MQNIETAANNETLIIKIIALEDRNDNIHKNMEVSNLFISAEFLRKVFSQLSISQQSVLQLVNKRWQKIADLLSPYFLYKIINSLATKYVGEYALCAYKSLIGSNKIVKDPQTNCFVNMISISVIASGQEYVKGIHDFLGTRYTVKICQTIDSLRLGLIFDNILTGPVLSLKNQNPLIKYSDKELTSQLHSLGKNYINSLISKLTNAKHFSSSHIETNKTFSPLAMKIAVSEHEYDFNEKTLSLLQTEISNNSLKVNETLSGIYYVDIIYPKNIKANTMLHYHCLVIEQYFSISQNQCLFRLYQSNIEQMTLKEYFEQRNYKDFSDQGCLNSAELANFFIDLKLILNGIKGPIDVLCKRCFGSLSPKYPPVIYEIKTKTLHGFSLRYKSEMFNPKDCLKNFFAFFKAHKADFPEYDLDLM